MFENIHRLSLGLMILIHRSMCPLISLHSFPYLDTLSLNSFSCTFFDLSVMTEIFLFLFGFSHSAFVLLESEHVRVCDKIVSIIVNVYSLSDS